MKSSDRSRADGDIVERANALTSQSRDSFFSRREIDIDFMRSFLYHKGVQWFHVESGTGAIREQNLEDWVPKPLANFYAMAINHVTAILSKAEPNVRFLPEKGNDAEDVLAAEMGQKVLRAIDQEVDVEAVRYAKAPLLALTGNAFEIVGVQDRPVGRYKRTFYSKVASPFQIFGDLSTEEIGEMDTLVMVTSRSKHWVDTHHPGLKGGGDEDILSMQYHDSLPYISKTQGTSGRPLLPSGRRLSDRRYEKYVWGAPDKMHPDGFQAIVIGDAVVAGPAPLPKDKHGTPFIPVVHTRFNPTPGCFFGLSPLQDLLSLQDQVNRLLSLSEVIILRTCFQTWLTELGVEMSDARTEPNAERKWKRSSPSSSPPQRLDGAPFPSAMVEYMKQIREWMGMIVSLSPSVLGHQPYSGSPAALVDTLIQQGLSVFGPGLASIARGVKRAAEMKIELYRVYGDDTRQSRVLDNQGNLSISSFNNADFQGGVNVIVETNSVTPRNNVVDVARTREAINLNLVNLDNPNEKYAVLRSLEKTDLASDLDVQYKAAWAENERMKRGETVRVLRFVDNPDIHVPCHVGVAADPATDEETRRRIQAHIEAHHVVAAMPPPGQQEPPPSPAAPPEGEAPPPPPGGEAVPPPAPPKEREGDAVGAEEVGVAPPMAFSPEELRAYEAVINQGG